MTSRRRGSPRDRLAANVQRLRTESGLSMSELAGRCGMSKSTLSEIERGKGNPGLDVLVRIAEGLGVEFDELFKNPRHGARENSGEASATSAPAASQPHPTGSAGRRTVMRKRILEQVVRIYTQRGFQGTGMAAVAEALDITPSALYYHFESKEGMLFAANRDALQRFIQIVRPADEHDGPTGQLRSFAHAHALFQARLAGDGGEAPYAVTHLKEFLTAEHLAVIEELQHELRAILMTILERGEESGEFQVVDVQATAMAIFSMPEYLLYWYRSGGVLEPHDIADLYCEFTLRLVVTPLRRPSGDVSRM